MDGFEINKIMGAVTGTLAVFLGINILADGVFSHGGHHGEEPKLAYAVAVAGGGEEKKEEVSFETLLAQADVADGEKAFKACTACHNVDQGGPNQTGPALYGVVGRPIASHDGFAYAGLAEKSGADWDFESLDAFLANPKNWAPGTAMAYRVRKPEDRAALIAFLNANTDTPLPLPGGAAEAAPEAEGETSQ